MKYVLDTSFFLSGMDPSAIQGEVFITPEIREEVKKGFPARKMDYFLESGIITIATPSEETLKLIRKKAEETGDASRLSDADFSILALAMELSATIVTDDYSVQNMASLIGISYTELNEEGISEVWIWVYRCTGCGKAFAEHHEECPVCGSPVRPIPAKNRKK